MTEHEASRTLVKSTPELWAECSDAGSLARHLDQFGEIRITRLDPESTVAWEGEEVSGTVRLEPSGWGTRVTLTARRAGVEPVPPPDPSPDPGPEPEPPAEPDPLPPAASAEAPRRGVLFRFLAWFGLEPVPRDAEAESADGAPEFETEPAEAGDELAVSELRSELPYDAEALLGREPAAPEPAAPDSGTRAVDSSDHLSALTAALESLGQAHHRPFSRA
jgi:hypothetical protein